jgi:hypothetical protein
MEAQKQEGKLANQSIWQSVNIITQADANLCWFACFQMIYFCQQGKGQATSLSDPANVALTANMYANDQPMTSQQIPSVCGALGFTWLQQSLDADGLANLLTAAPIMYLGITALTANPGGHAVILNGISGVSLSVIDPWDGVNYWFPDYTVFVNQVLPQSANSALIYPP